MGDEDLDDFLGVPRKRGPGRPRKVPGAPPAPKKPAEATPVGGGGERAWQALHRPVSIEFLSLALSMARRTVATKLAKCPTVPGTDAYDFKEAMAYLITPRVTVAEMLADIKKSDLPTRLQSDYWDAKLKEQKWLVNAGDLWHTDRVLEVFGEAMKRMKNQIIMFSNEIDDVESLTPAQRQTLNELLDGLQRDLHAQLVELSEERSTPNQAVDDEV